MYFLRRLHGAKLLSVKAMLNATEMGYGDDEYFQRGEQETKHVPYITIMNAHMISGLPARQWHRGWRRLAALASGADTPSMLITRPLKGAQ